MGASTDVAIVGNKLAPGVGDWYLAKNGYDSQQTSEPAKADRPNNLWRPLPQEYGAHGRFDDRAHHRSGQLWMTTHRGWFAGTPSYSRHC